MWVMLFFQFNYSSTKRSRYLTTVLVENTLHEQGRRGQLYIYMKLESLCKIEAITAPREIYDK